MFDHLCTECDKRQLIFPSQVTSLVNTDHGIIVAFTCWCGAEQTMLTGRRRPQRARRRLSARGGEHNGRVPDTAHSAAQAHGPFWFGARAAPYTSAGCPAGSAPP